MRAIDKPAVMQFDSGEKALMASVITAAVSTAGSVSQVAVAVQFGLDDALKAVDDYREKHPKPTPRSEDHPVLMHVVRSMSKNGPAS